MAEDGDGEIYNGGDTLHAVEGNVTEERDLSGDMETIDLNGKPAGGSQQPTLAFMQQTSSDSQQEEKEAAAASPGEVPAVETQIEGTVQKQSRTRSRSGNLGIKEWGSHQLKITKQLVQERFGHGVRTVDSELEHRLESLKETQKKYSQLMSLARQFQTHFSLVVDTQKSMAEHFAFMSVRAPELHTEFHLNSETQKIISRNGETLLAAMKHFSANMNTVTTKTMEDTLQTAKGYDQARLAYDAYRSECENLQKQAATSQKAAANLTSMSGELEKRKKKFEQFRHDIDIKLKLLDENKLKVTHKQLILLQEAFAAYFSGSHEALEGLLAQFKGKLEESGGGNNDPPAWLEDLPSQQNQSQ